MALRVAGSVTAIGSLIVGGVANEVLFLDAAGKLAQSSDLVFNSITAIHTIGGTTAGAGLVVTGGTITADVLPLSISQTRNNATVIFSGLKITYTDTAISSGSSFISVKAGAGGATNVFAVGNGGVAGFTNIWADNGILIGNSATTYTLRVSSAGSMYWYTSAGGLGALWTGLNGNSQLTLDSKGSFSWTNTQNDPTAAVSANFSLGAAGVVFLGTGAQGSSAGRLKLTSAIAAGVAVGSLNASPTTGEIQSVTDALAPAAGSAVAAGGAAKALVWYNGAQWTVIGV